ncbi:MAG: SPOR domain-containing protein [Flavobacteriales bacterium]|nr:SPOR domain-containing protein [Flavobacteriales bacterium]
MVLDKYISDLLYRYECVIVPGFGGFITNRVSAKNISSQHKFFPPTKEIAFNKNLDTNDGLLANYLVQAKKISYTHAVEIIETNVADWQTLLDEDNTFDIKKIGSFRLNEERNLEFTAVEDVNYLTDSYGLSSFTSLAIKRAGEKAKVRQLNHDDSVSASVSIRKYVRYAAIIIPFIAIGALSFYQINTSNTPVSNANIGLNPESTIVEKPVSNIEEKTTKIVSKPIVKPVVEPVVIPVKEEAKPIVVEKKVLKYHVISGAFSKEANANRNIRILKSKGIEAELIGVNKNGLYMVSYGSFDNVKDASKFNKTIKSKYNKGAWVWKKIIK